MDLKCKFKDGKFGMIPCVMWHPAACKWLSDGLWAYAKNIDGVLSKHGKSFKDIVYAEAPVEIYLDYEGTTPWREPSLLLKTIKAGENLPYGYWTNPE